MDAIEDIYSNDVYLPFIIYCREHNYRTMQDLRRCSFDRLINVSGMNQGLLLRIKTLYTAYCKKHPDMHIGSAPPRPRAVHTPSAPPPELAERLETYFKSHTDALIRLPDLCKELGCKRGDITKTLEKASWCKAVDSTTFFYSPV